MRLLTHLALASLATLPYCASATDEAEVYILTADKISSSSSAIPSLPRQLARKIIHHRLGNAIQFEDLPADVDDTLAIQHLLRFSHAPLPLFGDGASTTQKAVEKDPAQLVVVLEGVTDKNGRILREALQRKHGGPAFLVADPPSTEGNLDFVEEFSSLDQSPRCDIASAMSMVRKTCWREESLVVRFDAAKDEALLDTTAHALTSLSPFLTSRTLETTLILIPESSRSSHHRYWSDEAPDATLERRYMLSDDDEEVIAIEYPSDSIFHPTVAKIPTCFTSYNACVTTTSNCTGHGMCRNKYASTSDGQDDHSVNGTGVCFTCSCLSTLKNANISNGTHVHWGGNMCQKIDVSTPFWMLAGTSIVLVGAVSLCLGMLFSVGEEKLPGVIGAGVSRGK